MGIIQARRVYPKRKPKVCKGCKRPVSITIQNLGYCKKCIAKARGS